MTNFDTARQALKVSLESSGSAMAEHAKWSESLEARLLKLKASWQSFAQTFMDSKTLKVGIDLLIGLVNVLEKLIDNFGLLGTAGIGVAIKGLFDYFKGTKEAVSNLASATTEASEAVANITSTSTEAAEAMANTASAATETGEAMSNVASSTTEAVESTTNMTSAATELGEATTNVVSTTTEAAESIANVTSAATENAESMANATSAATEAAEATANIASAATEAAEATTNMVSGGSEIVETIGNVANAATDGAEAVGNIAVATTEAGEMAVKSAGGFKKFFGTLAGKVAIIGAVVAGLALLYNWYKKNKEAAAEARQEAIRASNEFLDAATSFEQAYIKYSGRTDLTAQEESELESAIQGTVDALGDKSSALQGIVNNSNDYLASLEAIKNAELEAAKNAAENKRDNAAEELKEAAIGWESWDGSEVDIAIGGSEARKIAEEVGGKFFKTVESSVTTDDWGRQFGKVESFKLQLSSDADVTEILDYYNVLLEYKEKLQDAGLDDTAHFENVEAAIEKMSGSIDVYTDGVYEAVKANYQLDNGIPKTVEEYIAMRESILKNAQLDGYSLDQKMTVLNDLDSEYGKLFDISSAEAQARKFVGIIEGFGDGTIDGTNEIGTVETFLNMRTAVNNNECSVGQYLSEFDNVKSMSEKFSDEEQEQFNLAFGLDTDAIKEQYDDVYNYITRNYLNKLNTSGMTPIDAQWYKDIETEKIKDLLDSLTASELSAFVSIKTEIDWQNTSKDEILKQIQKEAEFLEAMNYTIAIDVETGSVDALNSAMAESVSAAGLSSESIAALKGRYAELASQGYDLSAMFEETSNGIHLNKSAVSELEQAYASSKLAETDGQLEVLKRRYNELTNEIKNCTDAGKRADLYSDQQEVAQKINDLATLASQYEGLASAYNAWQNTEAAGNERDMYENIISGFETVEDEISRGWYDDGTIKFLELITGKTNLAGKSASELKEIWNGLDNTIKGTSYSVKDFFTTDDDGNSTSTGAYNFLRAVEELGKNGGLKALKGKNIEDLIVRNDKNKIVEFDFDVVGGDSAIAKALGVSEEMVQIIQRTLDDAGFVVTLDGKYTLLADLQTSAEEATNKLKKLKTEGLENLKNVDLEFDFDVDTVEGYQEQLEKAVTVLDKFRNKDGTLQTDANGNLVEGAKNALEIAEYYTAAMDKLTEPKFMQIDTSTVDEELQEPIEKIQEIGDLCKEKHLVTLTGDTEGLKEVQGEIDKVAKEIEELKPEVKTQIGIDEDWDADTIADKIEKGELEIPAELQLDVQMSDDLKDMRLMMMNQLGLASNEEVKLKVGYDIDESLVDTLDDKEQEIVLKYITENEEEFEKLTEEEKEVLIKYIAENKEEFEKMSEEDKEILVNYIADGGDIEKFDAELKKEKSIQVIVDTFGTTSVEELSEALEGVDSTKVQAVAEALGKKDVDELNKALDGMEDNEATALAQALGYDDVEELKKSIADMRGNTVDASVDTEGQADKIADLQSSIDGLEGKRVNIWLGIKKVASSLWNWVTGSGGSTRNDSNGFSDVNGTANVNGTAGRAFKQGSWGTKNSGTALVGELGREVLVRGGKYYTIGDYGAEFIKYKKGDIIFNHVQSEELFKNGRVTSGGGRAKSFVGGTAFAQGAAFGSGSGGGIEPEVSSKSSNSSSNSSSDSSSDSDSDTEKEFEEVIDLIEIAINRIERNIDTLDRNANNVFKSWSSRSSALISEISKVGEEISLQQSAYDAYMKAASEVGLSSSWISKIQNGSMDISTITDEDLADKISKYQEYYEKALDCKDAIEELKEKELSLYQQRFDNIATQYEGMLSIIEHEKNMIDEYIAQSEAQAHLISANYYNALISNEKETISKLQDEKSALLAELGTQERGTEQWYTNVAKIDEVTLAIEQSNTAIKEYQQTIQQLKWEQFDLLQEKISAITEEADFLIELMSSDKLFDDNGKLTDEGSATMGLHGVNYNVYMHQADQAREEAERLKKELSKDPYDTELEARYREMIALQQEHILAAEGEKEAIRDLVEEGINTQLDSLQELIDKKNELLDSERDLYEYQKKVKEQTSEIAALEKQLSAYGNDDSEESQAKIQQIKVDLESARQDLEETETDRLIEGTAALLDNLYLEYEEILNMRLDNLDALIADVIAQINADATSISATLTQAATDVGYNLSTDMSNIWDVSSTKINSAITTYGDRFSSAQTTTNTVLGNIKTDLGTMIGQLNKIANTNAKSAANSSAANNKQTGTSNKTTSTTTSKTNTSSTPSVSISNDIKVGGKINAGSAKIYDYAGDTSGERQLYRNDPIYNVLRTDGNWIQVRYHKLSSGVTGWFKKSDVKAYATGAKKIDSNDWAWTQEGNRQEFIVRPSDGAILTPVAKGDSVLNANASRNIWNMANSPSEFIRDNLSLDSSNIPNNSNSQSSYSQNFENITFSLPNVRNYNELLSDMQKDPKFEKLILAMTTDQIAGRSKLAKGKAIR